MVHGILRIKSIQGLNLAKDVPERLHITNIKFKDPHHQT